MKFTYLKKILAFYFAIGGIILLIHIVLTLGFWGMFTSLFPTIMTLAIFSFFITVGFLNLFSNKVKYESLINICLLIQSIQVVLLGFSIKNYFMPFFGIGFTDTPTFLFNFEFKFFDFLIANGLNKQSDEVSLTINLIPVVLMFILHTLKNNDQSGSVQKLSFE